jgi:hypothetical protein
MQTRRTLSLLKTYSVRHQKKTLRLGSEIAPWSPTTLLRRQGSLRRPFQRTGSFGTQEFRDELTTIGNATHLRRLTNGLDRGQMID